MFPDYFNNLFGNKILIESTSNLNKNNAYISNEKLVLIFYLKLVVMKRIRLYPDILANPFESYVGSNLVLL